MNIIPSMQRKVIGGYLNANEMLTKEDAVKIHSIVLDEGMFSNVVHRAFVRAINMLKKTGAEVCELNATAILERGGMPRNLQESEEMTAVISEYAVTPKSFSDYLQTIKRERAMRVAI